MATDTSHFEQGRALTIGEQLRPAMRIAQWEDAQNYLVAYTFWLAQAAGLNHAEARRTALFNVGYYAGYCAPETRDRVLKLFNTTHPLVAGYNPLKDGTK